MNQYFVGLVTLLVGRTMTQDSECSKKTEQNTCIIAVTRWKYTDDNGCVSFLGCPGASNNFDSKEACFTACDPNGYRCTIRDTSDIQCFVAQQYFEYDGETCVEKNGCPPPNTFYTNSDCMATCDPEGFRCTIRDTSGIQCLVAQQYFEYDGETCVGKNGCPPPNPFYTNSDCMATCDPEGFRCTIRDTSGIQCLVAQQYFEYDGKQCVENNGCPPPNYFATSDECSDACDQCSAFCARARCEHGTECRNKDDQCGCYQPEDPCEEFCSQVDCTDCGQKSDGTCGCGIDTECEEFCQVARCGCTPHHTCHCGVHHGQCGCHQTQTVEDCNGFCAVVFCAEGYTCGLKDEICTCIPIGGGGAGTDTTCATFCSRARCTAGTTCGFDRTSNNCGCRQTPTEEDCTNYCAVVDCAQGYTCGLKDGTCQCYKTGTSPVECSSFCSVTICSQQDECTLRNGECGCYSNSCAEECKNITCEGGDCSQRSDGTCGCHSEDEDCDSYCARVRCKSGYSCHEQDGECGCFEVSDSDSCKQWVDDTLAKLPGPLRIVLSILEIIIPPTCSGFKQLSSYLP